MRLTPLDSFRQEISGRFPGLQVCSLSIPAEAQDRLSGFIKALAICRTASPKNILWVSSEFGEKEWNKCVHRQ